MKNQISRVDDRAPDNSANSDRRNPRKILHVVGTADRKGAAICRIVESLAVGTAPSVYEVEACFLEAGEFTDQFLRAGIKSTCVNWNGKASHVRGALRYAALLRSASYSIIHQHVGGRSLTRMGRYLTGAKIVLNLHGRASEETGEIPVDCILPLSDLFIANSEIVARYSKAPNARVIYPGIDASSLPPKRNEHAGIVIGTACRLELIKGIYCLIEAFALLAAGRTDLRLEIAGEGSLRTSLEEQSRKLGVSAQVAFLGWRDDLSSVMAGWDIFVQPSLDEGFGVAALEGMAAGLPVVASAVGGLCDLVVDGETGFLVPTSVPADLAARILELVNDASRREAMGIAARQRAIDRFPMSRMIEQTFAVYDELLLSR
jgi:glycosyltransferase involved in cell wall biosynthesis